jgi:hypothetical protein
VTGTVRNDRGVTGTVRNDRGVTGTVCNDSDAVVRMRMTCNALPVSARPIYVRRIALSSSVLLLILGAVLAACASAHNAGGAGGGQSPSESISTGRADLGSLSPRDYETARSIALREAEQSANSVTSATATRSAGTITDSNTGHACTSGSVLHIKLIGDFNIVTTGHPILNCSTATPDFTVHGVLMTADPASGDTCLISVQTGTVKPDPGATVLFTNWH